MTQIRSHDGIFKTKKLFLYINSKSYCGYNVYSIFFFFTWQSMASTCRPLSGLATIRVFNLALQTYDIDNTVKLQLTSRVAEPDPARIRIIAEIQI